jgi:hypothetical protein
MLSPCHAWLVSFARMAMFLAVLAGTPGCSTPSPPSAEPSPIEVGISGAFGAGALAHDEGLRRKESLLLDNFRLPIANAAVDLPFSRLLFADRVEGTVLAVAAAKVADSDSYWIVESSGPDIAHLSITANTSYVGALLGDGALVPIRSACCGPRYLISSSIRDIEINGGPALPVHGGLSDRAPVHPCTSYYVELRSAGTSTGYLDLGPGVAPITTPIIGPPGTSAPDRSAATTALRGLDTCRASTDPQGVISTAVGAAGTPAALTGVTASSSTGITLPAAGDGTITELTWYLTTNGRATSAVWRPAGGEPPVFSPTEKEQDIQVLPLELQTGRVTTLTWSAVDMTLSLPHGIQPLFQTRGLAVLGEVTKGTTVTLVKNGQPQAVRTIS